MGNNFNHNTTLSVGLRMHWFGPGDLDSVDYSFITFTSSYVLI